MSLPFHAEETLLEIRLMLIVATCSKLGKIPYSYFENYFWYVSVTLPNTLPPHSLLSISCVLCGAVVSWYQYHLAILLIP